MGVKIGDLEVLDMVATGGMAEVYRARINDRLYAVKKILPQFTRERDLVQMFMDEARVAQLLKHPNIITVMDLLVTDAGELYIAMEYADGRDLADLLYAASIKGLRVSPALATYVAREVLHALEYAHAARDREGRPMQLIHRDISPHNVMLGFDGWVKLMDFGIAKVAFSGHQTMAGVVKGKFGYMSPEQARGKKLDGRSDLYNVGILLYEMITGERLFTGSSDISTLDRMRSAEVPAMAPVLRCPPDLEAVIRRALAKGVDDRFPDATAFEMALGQVSARNGYVSGSGDGARLVRELFGSSRLGEPPPPTGRRHLIAVQSPIAKTPADSPLLAAPAALPVTAERLKSVVMGGKRVTLLSEAVPSRAASSEDTAGQTEMMDPSMVPDLSAAPREDSAEHTLEQDVFNAPSSVRLKPVAQAPSAPLSKSMDKQDERGVFDSAPAPAPAAPRRTTSQDRAPAAGIRSSLPSIPSMPAAPAEVGNRSVPRLAPVPAAPGPVESTRFDAPPTTRPDQRKPTGQQPQAMVPQGSGFSSGIVTKASLQALPSSPPPAPRTVSSPRMPLVPGPANPAAAAAAPAARSKSLSRMPAVPPPRPPEERKRSDPRNVVWEEPSLEEESLRLAPDGAAPRETRKPVAPKPAGVDPSAVTGEVDQPKPLPSAPLGSETSMFMNEALAAADGLLAEAPVAPPPAVDDDKERRKQEALERARAKKAAKEAPAEAAPVEAEAVEAAEPVPVAEAPKFDEAEFGTTPDAPPSAPHPARAGKVLEAPVVSYNADARPMAKRGAWFIGEPAISPGTQQGAARGGLALFRGKLRRRSALVFAAAAVGSYFLAAQKPQLVAHALGKLAPALMAGVSDVPTPPANTVALTVRTGPPGCKLWIDGEPVEGESPLTLHHVLSVGSHKVLAVKGKQRKETAFTLVEGQKGALVTVPVVADGEVDVSTEEPGTTVWLDGRLLGPAPRKLTDVSRDRARHLQVRLGDRVLVDQRLLPDRAARLAVDPWAGLGLTTPVNVTSYPPAFLSLGGKELVQTTGAEPIRLPAGKQTLTLRVPALGLTRELALEVGGRGARRYHVELVD